MSGYNGYSVWNLYNFFKKSADAGFLFSNATFDDADKTITISGGGGSSAVTVYTPTLTPCSNTTTPTDILSVTIPANDWADGEKIDIEIIVAGSTNIATLQLDMAYGSDSYTDLAEGAAPSSDPQLMGIRLWRVGSDLYISKSPSGGSSPVAPNLFINLGSVDSFATSNGTILTPVTFNTEKDLVITATYSVADAGDSIEILTAKVVKI